MTGIYKITYNKDGRCYIGQSINIEHRLKEHKKCEGQSYIHNAIKKYGLSNFTFEVVEECSRQELDEKERYWIKFYNSYENGFNQTKGGQSFDNEVAVDCFNFNGDRIATYLSIAEAEEATGSRHISSCINGDRKQSGGYQWKKHSEENYFIDIYKKSNGNSKSVSQFTLDGKFLNNFGSISEAAKIVFNTDNGSLRRRIKKACELHMGQADGYLWSYYNKSEIAQLTDLLD